MRGDGFEELEARGALVHTRRLGEEDREVRGGSRFGDARRQLVERPISGPELEPRLAARVLQRGRERRSFRDERLVDDDEHALARDERRSLDEVLAPTWVREALHALIVAEGLFTFGGLLGVKTRARSTPRRPRTPLSSRAAPSP